MIGRRLARVGLRARLTLAFVGAMALVLAGLGMFVFTRFESSLDRSLDQELRARAEYVRALVMQSDTGLAQAGQGSLAAPGERFAQILRPGGRIVDETSPLPRHPLLGPTGQERAARAPLLVQRVELPQPVGSARLLAVAVRAQDQQLTVIVGTSLRGRDGALADVRTVLLLGGPAALLLASLLGYAVAAFSLRTVEAMRRRAHQLSPLQPGGRLPVPAAGDELSRLAATLNEMLERTERAFAHERAFVADASHELRSPVAIMRAELDAALLGESSPAELRGALESAVEEAERLSALTDDLLTLAQADEGQVRLRRGRFDALELLESLVARYETLARRAHTRLATDAPPGLELWADRRRLEQALGNLIDNALRHGAGTVRMQARCERDCLVLEVSDEGPGFPPATIGAAFERFARGERARTSPGAGLGLSIVQAIVRSHGGEVRLANAPGGGAAVQIEIPLQRPHDRSEEGQSDGPPDEHESQGRAGEQLPGDRSDGQRPAGSAEVAEPAAGVT